MNITPEFIRSRRRLSALFVALTLLLAGCSSGTETGNIVPAANGQSMYSGGGAAAPDEADRTIIMHMGMVTSEGAGIYPLTCKERDLVSLNALVFESVVELDDAMHPSPLLADRWSAEDGVWTFVLRNNILFHDGTYLDSADVIATYNYIVQLGDASPYYARVKYIKSMEYVDNLTIRVTGEYAGYMTLYAMTFPVISEATLTWEQPCGTGPYWYMGYDGTTLQLDVNPLWWKYAPSVDKIVATRYVDTSAALVGMSIGEIDTLATRSLTGALSRNLSDRVSVDYSTMTYECMLPNLSNRVLASADTRKAIMYAINRTVLADNVYLGMVQESEVPVIPGTWLYETQSAVFNYSPERALQLLYQAGWEDSNGDGILDQNMYGEPVKLAFEILTYVEDSAATRQHAAEYIAEQLGKLGMEVTVTTAAQSDVQKRMKNGNFDVALIAISMSEMPDFTFLFEMDGRMNYGGYVTTEMTNLLQSARVVADEEDFKSVYSQIQMKIVEDLPIMGLFFRKGTLMSTMPLGGLLNIRESQTLRGIELLELK